jgi:protocatechuate 3,4-dioxygenase beta subunit
MPHAESLNRRRALAWAGAAVLATELPTAQAQTRKRPTPAQTEGPFYPVREPRDADFDLLKNGALAYAAGRAAWVEGVVTDLDGKPLKGARIEIWQCDASGHYDHPRDGARSDPAFQGFGRVVLDAQGAFRFRTIQPVAYSGRTPHIHAKLKLGQRELLTTQLYVAGDPGNLRDGVYRALDPLDQAAVSAAFEPGADGLKARYVLAVAG